MHSKKGKRVGKEWRGKAGMTGYSDEWKQLKDARGQIQYEAASLARQIAHAPIPSDPTAASSGIRVPREQPNPELASSSARPEQQLASAAPAPHTLRLGTPVETQADVVQLLSHVA